MIQKISAEDLKKMQDREGLVLQGCGGDLREWEDGIHQMLAEEKILQNGAHFKEIYAFEHDGCTNLLFMMDGIELDTGRLVLWRLRTHAQFGGTWLSDYLPNRLGVEETVWDGKPDCPLIGANGNIFNLMGIAARTLAENDRNDEAKAGAGASGGDGGSGTCCGVLPGHPVQLRGRLRQFCGAAVQHVGELPPHR